MQRSRKALLERRAIEKATSGRNYLYKVFLSLVIVLWGLVFLFSLWISRGHGNRGISCFLLVLFLAIEVCCASHPFPTWSYFCLYFAIINSSGFDFVIKLQVFPELAYIFFARIEFLDCS